MLRQSENKLVKLTMVIHSIRDDFVFRIFKIGDDTEKPTEGK
jgi:hypothetical protein